MSIKKVLRIGNNPVVLQVVPSAGEFYPEKDRRALLPHLTVKYCKCLRTVKSERREGALCSILVLFEESSIHELWYCVLVCCCGTVANILWHCCGIVVLSEE